MICALNGENYVFYSRKLKSFSENKDSFILI